MGKTRHNSNNTTINSPGASSSPVPSSAMPTTNPTMNTINRPSIKIAELPEDFAISESLKAVLNKAKISLTKGISRILVTFGVYNTGDGYMLQRVANHIGEEPLMTALDDIVGTAYKLVEIGNFLLDKEDDYELQDDDKVIARTKDPTGPGVRSTPHWTFKKLDDFDGAASNWISWKEGARAIFSQCGLYGVLNSKTYAKENSEMNAAVHGMLTICFANNKFPLLFATIGYEGNGYGAWKYLCDFYECSVMTNAYIRNYTNEFDQLKETKLANFMTYATKFLLLKDRLDHLHKRMEKFRPTETSKVAKIDNYVQRFFEQLQIPELRSRAEIVRRMDSNKEVPYYIKQLFDYMSELGTHHVSHGGNSSPGHSNKGGGSNQGSTPPKPSVDPNLVFKQECQRKLKTCTDEAEKKVLQTFIDRQDQTSNNGNKRPHNGHGKAKRGKRARRAKAAQARASGSNGNVERDDY